MIYCKLFECSRETGSIFCYNKKNVIDGGFTNSDFLLNVKRNVIRFKAGSELSSSLNRMDVDVDEDITDEAHEWKITLVLKSERCSNWMYWKAERHQTRWRFLLFYLTVWSYEKYGFFFSVNVAQSFIGALICIFIKVKIIQYN